MEVKRAADEDGGIDPDAEDGDNGRKRVRKPLQLAQPRPISMRPTSIIPIPRNHGLLERSRLSLFF